MSEKIPIVCRFEFACPIQWEDLQVVGGSGGARHCTECEELVHPCRNYDQLRHHVQQGHCVAINLGTPFRTAGIVRLGHLLAEER